MHYSKCLCWFKCLEWETATAKYVRVNKLIILAREILIKIAPLFHGSYTKCIQNIYIPHFSKLCSYTYILYTKKSKELYMPAKFCVQNICKSLSKCGILLWNGVTWTYFWYISWSPTLLQPLNHLTLRIYSTVSSLSWLKRYAIFDHLPF